MISKIQGLFRDRWKFQRASLMESAAELCNPARGWYQIYNFQAQEKPALEELEWCLHPEDTLAFVMIDIGEYRERPLDEAALSHIRGILRFFADRQRDMILRIAYDHEGRAQEREPFFFTQVTEHLSQLCPLLEEYGPQIFVCQGMLVGNWGEMHTSRFLATDKLARMASLLNGAVGETSFLAVRRPMYWRALHPEACRKRDFTATRMGLFDDAIFGSDTHLGTFGVRPEAEMGWDDPWTAEEEFAFEEKLCQYVPQGGEVLYQEGAAEKRSLAETVARLRRMHISYLNRAHDERLLAIWKGMVWKESGPWSGVNGYDYIGRHLGYRFCVRNVTVEFEKGDGVTCHWEVSIENTGFARCYQRICTWIEWIDETGRTCRSDLSLDLSSILPGETLSGSCTSRPAIGQVYLYAGRKRDGAALCFANETEGRRGVLLGRLDQ